MKLKWHQPNGSRHEGVSVGNEQILAFVSEEDNAWTGSFSTSVNSYFLKEKFRAAEEMKLAVEEKIQHEKLTKWLDKEGWNKTIQTQMWLTEDELCRWFGNEYHTNLVSHPKVPNTVVLFSPFVEGEVYTAKTMVEDGRMWYLFSKDVLQNSGGEWLLVLLAMALQERNEERVRVLERNIQKVYSL